MRMNLLSFHLFYIQLLSYINIYIDRENFYEYYIYRLICFKLYSYLRYHSNTCYKYHIQLQNISIFSLLITHQQTFIRYNNKIKKQQMTQKTHNRIRSLIAYPYFTQKQILDNKINTINIFTSLQPISTIHKSKLRGRSFDFVGSEQFKQKYIQNYQPKPNQPIKSTPYIFMEQPVDNTQSPIQSHKKNNKINNFIKHEILTNQKPRQIQTKQMRQFHTYYGYRKWWNGQIKKLQSMLFKKQNYQTLLQKQVKNIYIHPNKNKQDIVNDNVVNMWQMSLRNNDKKLQQHIKGNKFSQKQLQTLLQTQNGFKKVQNSIPLLPFQKVKGVTQRQLRLRGTNRSSSRQGVRAKSMTERFNQTQNGNSEEIYKINYQKKWRFAETH